MNQEHLFIDTQLNFMGDEYVLGFVDGHFGHGKTIFLALLAYLYHKEYDYVVSNFKLNVPNNVVVKTIDENILLNMNPERKYDILMLLHESYRFFDKRECTKKENKQIMKTLFQIRKLNIDIFADIPLLEYLDFRAIENSNIYIHSHGKIINPENHFIFSFMQPKSFGGTDYFFTPINRFSVNMSEVFNVYDTYETVKPKYRLITEDFFKGKISSIF